MKRGKKRGLNRAIPIALLVALSMTCYGQFAGGRGTREDPWQIETAEHLANMREFAGDEHRGAYFLQIADIDLDVDPWNEGEGWEPIGSDERGHFSGTYNGGRFSISNLMINRETEHIGLFGILRAATIRNVGLKNVRISGGHYVGGIAGRMFAEEGAIIQQSYVSGSITGHAFVGGIVAAMQEGEGVIEDCYSTATLTIREQHGGGGIVAEVQQGRIFRCYSIGAFDVEHVDESMGAIIGFLHDGEVNNIHFSPDLSRVEQAVGTRPDEFRPNTTEQMMQRDTYEEYNFDEVWHIRDGASFPYFQWQGEEPEEHNLPPMLPPSDLRATAGNRLVNLSWTAPGDEDNRPDGYIVYRDERRINDELLRETEYQDRNLTNFTPYSYYVTAVYGESESMPSNVANAVPFSFPGGAGTEDNPYHISTAAELNGIRHFDYHFIQTANIDLGVAPWNEGEGWVPIGSDANNPFRGSYNGDNYYISGLTINRPEGTYQALFGSFAGQVIENVGLRDVDITGRMMVAGLIGNISGASTVRYCYVSGNILSTTSLAYIGGLVAYQSGAGSNLHDCYTNVNVVTTTEAGNQYAGGVISYLYNGQARRCYAAGSVATAVATTRSGAVIGEVRLEAAAFSHLYWNTDTATVNRGIGNVQNVPGNTTMQLMQANTYTGFDFDRVWRIDAGTSFPYLQWEGEEAGEHNRPALLPPQNLTGTGGNTVVNLNWMQPPDIMGRPNGYNVYRDDERINEALVVATQYQDTGLQNWTNYSYYVTAVYEGAESIPGNVIRTTTTAFAGGYGSPNNPYLVENEEQLNGIRLLPDANYLQTDDIMIAAETWIPIGESAANSFRGNYNGDGHTISGISMIGGNYLGLFGYVTTGAILKNIGLINVNVREAGIYSGTLAGVVSNSTVSNCYAAGTMNAINRAGGLFGIVQGSQVIDCWSNVDFTGTIGASGGLIGTISHNSIISGCISRGSTISTQAGTSDIGGLIGWVNSGTVSNSYSRSRVTAHNTATNVGGLIGRNQGNVVNSYAIGRIVAGANSVGGLIGNNTGNVTNSYWDINSTERENSAGGEGKTTQQMVYPYAQENTYNNWNFETIWFHDENRFYNGGYPALRHQIEEAGALDTPELTIEIRTVDNVDRVFITWEAVEGANSYRIYASHNPIAANWGQPVDIVAGTEFSEAVDEQQIKFYYVVASAEEAP